MNRAVVSFVTVFTVRYVDGRRTAVPKLVDFEQLRKQLEEAGVLAMAEPVREEAPR